MPYWNGVSAGVTFTSVPFAALDVANFNWNQDEASRLAEVTNALTGAVSAWLAGVADITGTFDVVWDNTFRPESFGLIRGGSGTITEAYGLSGNMETLTVIVEKIAKKVDIRQGAIVYNVSWKANGATNVIT